MRPDARHGAYRRGRPAHSRNRTALERQTHAFSGGRLSREPYCRIVFALDCQPGYTRMARLQTAMDQAERTRGIRTRGNRLYAEGLHQLPADRRASLGLERCIDEFPDGPGNALVVTAHA